MTEDKTQLRGGGTEIARPGAEAQAAPKIAIPGLELGKQLGQGGMAVVYQGLDRGFSPPRRVAVKLMDPALSGDPEFRTRFEREASIVAEFRHDNIVHVYSSGEVNGAKYIVMEYLPGGTLGDEIESGALPVGKALQTATSLASALAYSHAQDIVHRDFKPGNVMYTADEKPVLTDFGVAKLKSGREAGLTQFAAVIGAPRYMAPEQELGEEVTDKADVFSFGLTLYEMLTGKLPPPLARMKHDATADDEITARLRDVPAAVSDLILRCLRFEPSTRPSAAQCHDTLSSVTIRRRSDANESREATSRGKRSILLSVVLTAVFLASGAAVVLLQRKYGSESDASALRTSDVTDGRAKTAAAAFGAVLIDRRPESAELFVDGGRIHSERAELAPGRHEIIGVSKGHYGERRTVDVGAATSQTVAIVLSPTVVPSASDYDKFLRLADSAAITTTEIDSISERALQTALRVKLFAQQQDAKAHDQLMSELDDLTRVGDARAPVAMLLAEGVRLGRIENKMLTEPLLAASKNGDAMASFLIAIAHRSAVTGPGSTVRISDAAYRDYCARMSLVANQGWPDIAIGYLKRDSCTS